MISLPLKKIYTLIKEIAVLEPWKVLYETEIFGIRIPDSELIYFISVMGSGGEMRSIAAYKGVGALDSFWELQDPDSFRPERIFTIPQFMISFEEDEYLEEDQKEKIQLSGVSFTEHGEFPVIHQYIPGLIPFFPDEDSISDLLIVLEQSVDVIKRAMNDPDLIVPESGNDDEYLIRESVPGKTNEWMDKFQNIPPQIINFSVDIPEADILKLSRLPKKPNVVQLDLYLLPIPTKEDDKTVYYPFGLFLANKQKKNILDFELIKPFPDMNSMYEKVPSKIVEKLLTLPFKPFRIEIQNRWLQPALSEIGAKAGIEVVLKKSLEALDYFYEDFVNDMLTRDRDNPIN